MRQAWCRVSLAAGLMMAGRPDVAQSQGVVQLRQTLMAPVPAVAVLSATTTRETSEGRAATGRWRAVLRTGANDRHRLSVRGVAPGWTIRVVDGAVAGAPAGSGTEFVLRDDLARGYHNVTVILEGPADRLPVLDAVVRTTQVPGGLAVAALTLSR
jgi:hypothetical protein